MNCIDCPHVPGPGRKRPTCCTRDGAARAFMAQMEKPTPPAGVSRQVRRHWERQNRKPSGRHDGR